jgi:hypothetical protein
MLALPAQPGALGQRLFHHRRGIHEHLDRGPEPPGDELRQVLELALEHVVVVAVPRIDRNIAAVGPIERRQRIAVRGITVPQRNHAACLGP